MSGAVYPLVGNQRAAVDPRECVWLSASAGTGKTQVLSARVLRLLLQEGVDPSQILCLTFTRAGAAEMALRVSEVLANWVRMKDEALAEDLHNIGAPVDAETRARARTLFASVLDCPGGGLRIDTIHAFSQYLLATFPEEAGIPPGSQALEDRDRDLLAREVLTGLLLTAEREGDAATLGTLAAISRSKGPDAVEAWLMRCARATELWQGPGAWQLPMRPRVCQLLGLPADATIELAAALCSDAQFDVVSLRRCAEIQAAWGTKTGLEACDFIGPWLAASPRERLERIEGFLGTLLTQKGEPKSLKNLEKLDPSYGDYVARVQESIRRVTDMRALVGLADELPPWLELGRKFALLWDEAKQREGFVDFDDQIRQAARLLESEGAAPWIRYKLDRRFDHILIDEAQDTNAEQWAIIHALIDDFFSGEGAHGDKLRTIFTVGDYKQAIFRFQGTSPENFEAAKRRVAREMEGAAANLELLRSNREPRRLQDLGLGQSFRTAAPVLDFVDGAIARIGRRQLGLKEEPGRHEGQERPGLVTLWNTVGAAAAEGDEDEEEGWQQASDLVMANRIAAQVRCWLDEGYPLVKGRARNAGPGDIMVLVRKRRELAGLIVARLHAAGVPVAGVDRLRLGAPLAVKDLMAALRFAAQPLDDLNLASLLVSPLGGWSQEDLLAHGYRPGKVRLWEHLRRSREPLVVATLERLGGLLARADFEPPQALLHWLLVGPWRGRRALVARLGGEANDPINELLNAAHAYAATHTASLQGFIRWFDAGEGELKRDADAAGGLVRVMTVHGSKGLQAPIVILADAAGKPDTAEALVLEERLPGAERGRRVPLPGLARDQRVGPIAAAEEASAAELLEEHWRLLYVAMTRAEEALFIGSALGKREKAPHEQSWYAALEPLFGEAREDELWGARREWGAPPAKLAMVDTRDDSEVDTSLPDWALRPIGPEPRPPRPLAPSAAGEDLSPDPPLPPGVLEQAALRGSLLHRLLERLPAVATEEREQAALAWLERQAATVPPEERSDIAGQVLSVLGQPDWSVLFGPGSLAEVPLAATVGGQVIAGKVDRLLVTPERVLVVDYKSARRPPSTCEEVPQGTLRQMAAYQAALEAIYPGRTVECALLYTQVPLLIALPPEALAEHKRTLQAVQESF